uniref:Uncharacterized protein n=1 Tax=Anguilla anguilla TaxID=7936 RepID=A0A0E9PGH3_ANGAN
MLSSGSRMFGSALQSLAPGPPGPLCLAAGTKNSTAMATGVSFSLCDPFTCCSEVKVVLFL